IGLLTLLVALWGLSVGEGLSVLPWGATRIETLYQVTGFCASAAAIAIGVRRGWPDATNVGAGSFVVFLYTKFYQWWWDWMPAYLFFFIVGAVAILLILVLKRLRTSIAMAAS